jgi:hypothetical protein
LLHSPRFHTSPLWGGPTMPKGGGGRSFLGATASLLSASSPHPARSKKRAPLPIKGRDEMSPRQNFSPPNRREAEGTARRKTHNPMARASRHAGRLAARHCSDLSVTGPAFAVSAPLFASYSCLAPLLKRGAGRVGMDLTVVSHAPGGPGGEPGAARVPGSRQAEPAGTPHLVRTSRRLAKRPCRRTRWEHHS